MALTNVNKEDFIPNFVDNNINENIQDVSQDVSQPIPERKSSPIYGKKEINYILKNCKNHSAKDLANTLKLNINQVRNILKRTIQNLRNSADLGQIDKDKTNQFIKDNLYFKRTGSNLLKSTVMIDEISSVLIDKLK